jgi:hypothetical protein
MQNLEDFDAMGYLESLELVHLMDGKVGSRLAGSLKVVTGVPLFD